MKRGERRAEVLAIVQREHLVRQRAVADELGIAASSVAAHLERLEAEGKVVRAGRGLWRPAGAGREDLESQLAELATRIEDTRLRLGLTEGLAAISLVLAAEHLKRAAESARAA